MNIRQLATFYWISKLGTFSAAAERLHTSQANVSTRIRELEQELGVVLFDRIGRQVELTIKGRELVVHAERIVAEAARLRHAAGAPDMEFGSLRIGVVESVAVHSLVAVVNALQRRFPTLNVEFDIDLNAALVRKLARGSVDVAVVAGFVDDPEIRQRAIGSLSLLWVGAPALIGTADVVAPADLVSLPIISMGRDSLLATQMRAWFADAGVRPTLLSYCNNLTTMLQVARAGICICLVPESLVSSDIQTGVLRAPRLEPPLPSMTFCVVTRAETLDPTSAEVAEIVAQAATLAASASPALDV